MSSARNLPHAISFVVRVLVLWALVALTFWVAVLVAPGFELPSFGAAVLTTGAVVVINALLWPLVIRLVLPLTVITFGLGSLLLNAAVVVLRRCSAHWCQLSSSRLA
jgi:putative membrane protein